MKKKLWLLGMCLLGISATFAQGIKFEESKFTEALAKAKKEKKLVFVDIYTTWCGPCKFMSTTIFPQAEVGTFFNKNFINFEIDAEKGDGVGIAKKYQIAAYPTYLFLDGDGNLAYKSVGSREAGDFISEGQKAINASKDSHSLAYYEKEMANKSSDTAFLMAYIRKIETVDGNALPAINAYIKALPADKQVNEQVLALALKNMEQARTSDYTFSFLTEHKADFVALGAQNDYGIAQFITTAINNQMKSDVKNKVADALQTALAANQKYLNGEEALALERRYYVYTKDTKKYYEMVSKEAALLDLMTPEQLAQENQKLKDKSLQGMGKVDTSTQEKKAYYVEVMKYLKDVYSTQKANGMNETAWKVFQTSDDKALLQEAVKWSKVSLKLSDNMVMYLDTYANLLYKSGNKDEALKYEQMAIDKIAASDKKDDLDVYQATLAKMKKGENTWEKP